MTPPIRAINAEAPPPTKPGPTAPPTTSTAIKRGTSIADALRSDYLTATEIGQHSVPFVVRAYELVTMRQRDGTSVDKSCYRGMIQGTDEERILVLNRTAMAKLVSAGAETFEDLIGGTLILQTVDTAFGPGIVIAGILPPKTQ